jgi:hypothetical protein
MYPGRHLHVKGAPSKDPPSLLMYTQTVETVSQPWFASHDSSKVGFALGDTVGALVGSVGSAVGAASNTVVSLG